MSRVTGPSAKCQQFQFLKLSCMIFSWYTLGCSIQQLVVMAPHGGS